MDDFVVVSLIRHGMTEENERSAYIGWTDSPISLLGRERLQYSLMNKLDPQIIFSSNLLRCQQTAEIYFPSQKIELIEELKELNFGNWEGKNYEELKDLESYQEWLDNPFLGCPDGGESFGEFCLRVQKGWEKVKDRTIKTSATNIVIITHGGVIRNVLSRISPVKRSFFDWKIPYGGGYQCIWSKESFRSEEACTLLQVVPITEKPLG